VRFAKKKSTGERSTASAVSTPIFFVPKNARSLDLPDDFPDNVSFTLDIDGMDPSISSSTGTPVPG
jgi:hypothetical protein